VFFITADCHLVALRSATGGVIWDREYAASDSHFSCTAAPLAEYQAGFLQSFWLRKAGAGLAGLALIYGVCALLGRMVGRQRSV
jgi:hypothetical protein